MSCEHTCVCTNSSILLLMSTKPNQVEVVAGGVRANQVEVFVRPHLAATLGRRRQSTTTRSSDARTRVVD